MTPLVSAVVILAAMVLGSAVVFFSIKYINFRRNRARDLRRAIYINTIGELVSRMALPKAQLEGWRHDPVFAERLIDAIDMFDGAQRRHLVEIARHIALTDDLVRDLESKNVGKRLDAATALARLATPELAQPLTRALADPVAEVRVQVAVALSRIGTPESVTAILRRMNRERPWAARLMADALVGFESVAVAPVSAEILIATPEVIGEVRHVADLVRALGQIGDPTAEPALLHAIDSDDALIRLRAAEALGRAGSPRAVAAVMRSLSDEDWRVRNKAATALGVMGDPEAIPALRTAMRDQEWWVRQHAAEALAKIPGGRDELRSALDDEDAFARDAALERLTLVGEVRAARSAGPGDELYDQLTELGRDHLLEAV